MSPTSLLLKGEGETVKNSDSKMKPGCKCARWIYQVCARTLWAIPFNVHTPPMDDMVCLSQGVTQTSTVLGGTVSYFIVSRGVNSTVLGGKLLS